MADPPQNRFTLTEMSQRLFIRACHTSLQLITELTISLLHLTIMSGKERFHIDKKRNIIIMGNTDVSKVLGFMNRSIKDFNCGIVSILNFQEKII